MHKVYYNAFYVVIWDMFTRFYNVRQVNTRSHLVNIYLNHAVSSVRKLFMVFSGAFLWNSISNHLKKLDSLQLFKSKIIDDIIYRYI